MTPPARTHISRRMNRVMFRPPLSLRIACMKAVARERVGVRQDGIQKHEALHRTTQRGPFPVPVIRLADGLVERLVVNVIEPVAMERAGGDRRDVAARDELGERVVRLLTVCDAGKRAVLAFNEDPENTSTCTKNRACRKEK